MNQHGVGAELHKGDMNVWLPDVGAGQGRAPTCRKQTCEYKDTVLYVGNENRPGVSTV